MAESGGGGAGGAGHSSNGPELPSSLTLTDSIGQKLEVLLENTLGEGGQRHVVVYCPVWMVNMSHYRLRCDRGHGFGTGVPSRSCDSRP